MAGISWGCMDWMYLFMNAIKNYDDISIHPIQRTRLYVQDRPLIRRWHRMHKGQSIGHCVPVLHAIDQELQGDYIAVDCAGWYFANANRNCLAIEIDPISSKFWPHVHFEYDYLTWHPTYLPPLPVLAYHSTYFKYCELTDFITFCRIWSENHPQVIIALDPTKIKFNYLKYRLEDLVKLHVPKSALRILHKDWFDLTFVLQST